MGAAALSRWDRIMLDELTGFGSACHISGITDILNIV
jgi:hypothetical protein